MNSEKEEFLERFRDGGEVVFTVSLLRANPAMLKHGDIVLRKINDSQVAITGWRNKNQAESYLAEHFKNGTEKIIEVNWTGIQNFLQGYDEKARKSIVLDLV